MALIKAFKGLRPATNLVEKIAAKPYDVLNSDEARIEAEGNPYSFLHITKPEIDLPQNVNLYSDEVYNKAKENFETFKQQNWLVQDAEEYIYIYRIKMGEHTQTGLVCLSSVEDYWNDKIKKHEFTRPVKEEDRIKNMETIGAHPGPVFLAYKSHKTINELIEEYAEENNPLYDFATDDEVQHTFWSITEVALINQIIALFDWDIEATYIADGHHRAASAAKVGLKMKETNPNHTGKEAYNWFLSVIFPDDQLSIWDYNRVVTDLNGLSQLEFMQEVDKRFNIEKTDKTFKPQKPYDFGMYINKQWYKLTIKQNSFDAEHPVKSLDTYVIHQNLFEPILSINDQRKSDRIDFIGGIRGMNELEKRVDSGEMVAAFSIYPVSMEQLFAVADSGEVMPPKSTWFEPKLRSGLIIHEFK